MTVVVEQNSIPQLYSIETTRAALGGVSRSTVNLWIKNGKLRTVKICGRRLVVGDSIRELVETSVV